MTNTFLLSYLLKTTKPNGLGVKSILVNIISIIFLLIILWEKYTTYVPIY